MAISINTFNVNGLRDANKRMSFIQWLVYFNYDILCLQETHISSYAECSAWLSPAGYDCLISPGSNQLKHCPKTHRYSKIFNKNNIRVSYSCTDNLQTIIKKHNRKILETSKTHYTENNCNCRKK